MSRPPRRRRPCRVRRWEGVVDDVEGDTFWARLVPVGHDYPDLTAEFDLRLLLDAVPGVVFNLYVHRRGRKVRTVLRRKNLGVWTEEDIAEAQAKAREMSAVFEGLCD